MHKFLQMKLFGKSTSNAVPTSEEEIPVATLVPDHPSGVYHPSPSAPPPPPANAPPHQIPVNAASSSGPTVMRVTIDNDPSITSRFPVPLPCCPNCQQESRTKVRTHPTWHTWTTAGALFFLFWPLCWVPLVSDSCKQSDHFCTVCGNQVGSVPPFYDCCVETRG